MQVESVHVASKKRIGTCQGQPVVEVLLKGGLVLVTTIKDGKPKTIGAGPHRAVARWMAANNEPDVIITELSKDETVSLSGILSVASEYQALVDRWNEMFELADGK